MALIRPLRGGDAGALHRVLVLAITIGAAGCRSTAERSARLLAPALPGNRADGPETGVPSHGQTAVTAPLTTLDLHHRRSFAPDLTEIPGMAPSDAAHALTKARPMRIMAK